LRPSPSRGQEHGTAQGECRKLAPIAGSRSASHGRSARRYHVARRWQPRSRTAWYVFPETERRLRESNGRASRGTSSAGTVEVGESADVPVLIGHLPVGVGYEVALNALASDGATVCEGSSIFDVTDSMAVFTVIVHLECAIPTGSVNAEGVFNLCPVLDALDASPMDLRLGGVARLTLSAHDSDTGPGPLRYGWTVNGIRLTQQSGASLGFACSSVGQITIAATVSDGDPNPACADSSAVKVNCQ